jgi:MFS family permease
VAIATQPEPKVASRPTSLSGTGFWWVFANSVSLAMVMSADRFTFEWLTGETLDSSDTVTGIVLFALGAPVCALVLFAGALADRGDRKRMLLTTQAASIAVTFAAAVLSWTGWMSTTLAVVVAAAFGTTMAFAHPVRQSLIPALVTGPLRQKAIITATIGANVAMIAGPVMAGWVIRDHGIGWAFAVQALCFAIGMAMVWQLRLPPNPPRLEPTHLRADIRDALSFVWNHGTLRGLFFLLSVGGMLMAGATYSLMPKIARDEFGKDSSAAALAFGVMGLGMVCTSLLLMTIRWRLQRRGRLFMLGMVFGTSVGILQGLVTSWSALMLLMLAWGMGGGFYVNLNQTLIQELTPQTSMGRVMALSTLVNAGLVPVGALGASAIADAIGPQPAMTAISCVSLSCVLVTLLVGRTLRAQP